MIVYNLERTMEATGFKYNWKNMKTAAQDRVRWRRMVCDICSAVRDK